MDWADDVAYSTHDLEDGIKAGLISESKIANNSRIQENVRAQIGSEWDEDIWKDVVDRISKASRNTGEAHEMKGNRKDLISGLITEFIIASSAVERSGNAPASRYQFELHVTQEQKTKCEMLKRLVWELIIDDEHVATLERKAEIIVGRLFDEFAKFVPGYRTREMYPLDFRERLDVARDDDEKKRVACDFVAGMTDGYAKSIYSRLTAGESSSLLDII